MTDNLIAKQRGLLWACSVTLICFLRLRIQGFRHYAGPFLNRDFNAANRQINVNLTRQIYQQLLRTQRLPWSNCLTRSLALCNHLNKKGHSMCLRIGVTQKNGFKAHAWVETQHATFGESDQTFFTQLESPTQP